MKRDQFKGLGLAGLTTLASFSYMVQAATDPPSVSDECCVDGSPMDLLQDAQGIEIVSTSTSTVSVGLDAVVVPADA